MRTTIPPPVIGLCAGVGMWWLARNVAVGHVTFTGQTVLAGALIAVGAVLDVLSVLAFFRARTTVNPLRPEKTESLVVSGFYRFSRNPMYLGMLLILTGIAVYLGQPLNVMFLVAFVAVINALQIKPEEQVLTARFGQSYVDYCARVRRWV